MSEVCRICGSDTVDEARLFDPQSIFNNDNSLYNLIRPCNCRGEFSYVHNVCLSNWIEGTRKENCDICLFKYKVQKVPRSVLDWLFDPKQAYKILSTIACVTFVYYVSFVSVLVCRLNSEEDGNIVLSSIMRIVVEYSSYIVAFGNTLALCFIIYKYAQDYRSTADYNYKIRVLENEKVLLRQTKKQQATLRSSGINQKSVQSCYT